MLAWVNDENTLRAYGKANDAYAVFRKMLKKAGNPRRRFGTGCLPLTRPRPPRQRGWRAFVPGDNRFSKAA